MTLQEVLTHFKVERQNSNNAYQCKCPVHKDKKASLTITGKNGKVLIHCHAGCETKDILDAVGLTFADLGSERREDGWREKLEREKEKRIEAVYDYKSEDGKYLYSKVRFEGKYIRYITIDRANDKYKERKEVPGTLYRLPELVKAIKSGYPVYIVEGEKDVETLRKLGYTATTAGSAEDWKREYAAFFTGAKVVVLPDHDKPGIQLKDQIVKDLRNYAHSVRWTFTSNEKKGDVTDYLTKEGHTKDDLKQLVEASENIGAPWLYLAGKEPNQTLRVNGGLLAESISKGLSYLIVRRPDEEKDDFYVYEHGVYVKCNRNKVKSIILRYIPMSLASDNLVNNVYNLLLCQERNICSFNDLDADEKYINLKNGLYNLKTKTLEPHTPKLYSTIQIACEYSPGNNNMPTFRRYMDDLCRDEEGNVDGEKMAILQEYGGMLLSNVHVHRAKLCLVLYSLLGNTGKTQFINLISELLGNENTVNIPIQNMNEESKFALGSIVGKRLINVGDQTSSEIKDSSIFKQLTGGDSIKCEKKGKQPFNYRFDGGIIIACNNLPMFTDDKGGHLFERLCIVPCTNTIEQDRRDSLLLDKMLKERSAIFNWFLEGLHRIIENNFKVSRSFSCDMARSEYRDRLDTVYRFISEFFIVTGNKNDMVSKSKFESEYIKWCNENGFKSVNKQNIKDRMEANGCPAGKGNLDGKRGVMVYRNLKYRDTDFESVTPEEHEQLKIPFN